MTSGVPVSQEQVDAILRLAGEKTDSGNWRFSCYDIAERMLISERTVRRVIRQSAVKFGVMTAWQKSEDH